jgi:hypothetical protein
LGFPTGWLFIHHAQGLLVAITAIILQQEMVIAVAMAIRISMKAHKDEFINK